MGDGECGGGRRVVGGGRREERVEMRRGEGEEKRVSEGRRIHSCRLTRLTVRKIPPIKSKDSIFNFQFFSLFFHFSFYNPTQQ